MKTLGRHLLAEFYGCTDASVDDVERMRAHMLAAADAIGATVVGEAFHRYEPQGVSGTLLIAESHLSVHSWPEARYIAVDIFTCGGLDPRPGYRLLTTAFAASDSRMHEIVRGLARDIDGAALPDDVSIMARRLDDP
jgi:S-adenosylmethionine decarboxylase proenzyme